MNGIHVTKKSAASDTSAKERLRLQGPNSFGIPIRVCSLFALVAQVHLRTCSRTPAPSQAIEKMRPVRAIADIHHVRNSSEFETWIMPK